MRWTQRIPLWLFALITFPLALGPWPLQPSVHLWEHMNSFLRNGAGVPADLFDLLLHAIPAALFMYKVGEMLFQRFSRKVIQTSV